MLWNNLSSEAKTAQSLSDFNTNFTLCLPCLLLDHTDSMYYTFYFKCIYILYCNVITYTPPGNQLLLCVPSVVK